MTTCPRMSLLLLTATPSRERSDPLANPRCSPPRRTHRAEVLDWERRHLFAGTWTCLGRIDELRTEQGWPSRSALRSPGTWLSC